MNTSEAASVIRLFYRHQLRQASPLVEFLGSAGGFSGARFWKITDAPEAFCLRRWPIQASRDERRLHWIHRQLATAHAAGCDFLPVPVIGNDRETLVEHEGYLWQLEPWMPGHASYRVDPSSEKLVAAMQALARFHVALRKTPCRQEPPPGILTRVSRLCQLFEGSLPTGQFLKIENAADGFKGHAGIRVAGARICKRFRELAPRIHELLNREKTVPVEIQTIIGDVWHDHVLFTDDRVTGIVDFGAMRMDTPAADVARLLGSLAGDQPNARKIGLEAYQNTVPWIFEPTLIELFDDSTTLLAGLNWLEWICVEGRDFGDLQPVTDRLNSIAGRMDFMLASL